MCLDIALPEKSVYKPDFFTEKHGLKIQVDTLEACLEIFRESENTEHIIESIILLKKLDINNSLNLIIFIRNLYYNRNNIIYIRN